MRSLAAVELQLIFQFCNQRSLLLLARCSRFHFHAASSRAAWRGLPCISVSTLQQQLQQSISRSLLRFCSAGVHVRLLLHPQAEGESQSSDVVSEWLAVLEGVAPITELSSSGYRDISFSQLLEDPMFKTLRVLRIQNPTIDIRSPTKCVPKIEEMRLIGSCSDSLYAALPQLPRLRTLHFCHQYYELQGPHSDALCLCVKVTSLSFDQLGTRSLASVLSRRAMGVTDLTIQCKFQDDAFGHGSLRCLSHPPHLRTVTFIRCFHPALVLRALTEELLPQGPLRRLVINPMEQTKPEDDMPGSELVRDFISKLPLVELTFELWSVVPRYQRPGPNDCFLARIRGVDAFVSSWTIHQNMLTAMKEKCEQLVAAAPRVTLCMPSPGEATEEERDRDTLAYYTGTAAPARAADHEDVALQPKSCCSIC